MKFDTIIIGSGASGLYTALNLPKNQKIAIISKKELSDCNTYWAQGGISFARDEDDINLFIKDTLEAGAGCCDYEAVKILATESLEIFRELLNLGFNFDKDKDNKLHYTKEGAHSVNRILHAGGDQIGKILHSFLLSKLGPNVSFFINSTVFDLLIDDDICYGVIFEQNKEQKIAYANSVVIASGGVGSLFLYHTNDTTISGELQGIAIQKGIKVIDMEFMQFHPTVFINTNSNKKLLLSEALRGEGAEIVDKNFKRFLFDYDHRGELAPRDILSRAIFDYKNKTKENVYISFKKFSKEQLRDRFPFIFESLTSLGFSLPNELIPISPAFHYTMGGILTDLNAKVDGIKNLYAVGEVACTRVHGANRLASNSLLEALVFAKRSAINIANKSSANKIKHFTINSAELVKENDNILEKELKEIMWNSVGIIRKENELRNSLNRVLEILNLKIGRMLYLKALCAKEIINSALNRKESVGSHYIQK